jgi:hypothetical protein
MYDQVKLAEINMTTKDGNAVHLAYEETGDILEIVFPGVDADCSIELTDQILLGFNRKQKRAAGLTMLDFSILATPTEFGPRSFALTGLDNLPDDLSDIVGYILTRAPVNNFLKVVTFYTSSGQTIPLTYLENPQSMAVPA